MKDKEELRKEIVELKWRTLPFFERCITSRSDCQNNKFQLKKRHQIEKWQSRHIKNIAIILLILAILPMINPIAGIELAVFLVLASTSLFIVEHMLRKRRYYFQKALKLKRKLKQLA